MGVTAPFGVEPGKAFVDDCWLEGGALLTGDVFAFRGGRAACFPRALRPIFGSKPTKLLAVVRPAFEGGPLHLMRAIVHLMDVQLGETGPVHDRVAPWEAHVSP